MTNRRKFLASGSILALSAYSYHRGLRYPRLSYEPNALASNIWHQNHRLDLDNLIVTNSDDLHFRAFAPEPKLSITMETGELAFSVNNIATTAKLDVIAKDEVNIVEKEHGITRKVQIKTKTSQSMTLQWTIPNSDSIDFAVIGDTGGNTELAWCLKRAYKLGAQFLLHLGDFNYGNNDYQRAINYFHDSPLPCYISIGNHDFNDSGLVYHKFRNNLGPLNHSFTIAGTRFINLDTGADFFPAGSGLRGNLMAHLNKTQLNESKLAQQIFFTHRPLRDPRPGNDHIVGGINEVNWLSNAIKANGGGPLLTGHVHHSAELNINDIHQYTVGEGLGHEDILLQRQTAQMLMGRATTGSQPSFKWAPRNMPWSSHNSHTHLIKLKKRGDQKLIDWYQTRVNHKSLTSKL